MLQSCGQKSFNNTENPSEPPPAELRPPTHNPGSAPATDMLLVWNFHTSVARNLHFARILFHRTIFDSHMKINFPTVLYSQYYRNGRYNESLILLWVCVCLWHVTKHTSSVTHGWFSLSSTWINLVKYVCFKLNMHDLFDLSLPYEIAWLPE